MTGQEKGDFLIEVTIWAGLTVYNIDTMVFRVKRLNNRMRSVELFKCLIRKLWYK